MLFLAPGNNNDAPEMLRQRHQRATDAVAATVRNDNDGPWML
jgi:hypothetical protein